MPLAPYSTQQAIFWGEFVELAYQMYKDDPTNPTPKQPSNFPDGWKLVMDLTIDPVANIFLDTEFIGFIAQSTTDATQYTVIFRGTESDLDWIGDLELWAVPFNDVPNGGHTECGFTEMYQSVKGTPVGGGTVAPLTSLAGFFKGATGVTVAGHSLGGALSILYATVFAYRNSGVQLDCYTYAAPMVGNSTFAAAFSHYVANSYRIYNFPDLVPRVPGTELGYTQVAGGIEINSLLNTNIHWNIGCFHALVVYLTVLGATGYGLGPCAVNIVPASQAVLPGAAAPMPIS